MHLERLNATFYILQNEQENTSYIDSFISHWKSGFILFLLYGDNPERKEGKKKNPLKSPNEIKFEANHQQSLEQNKKIEKYLKGTLQGSNTSKAFREVVEFQYRYNGHMF